LKHLAVSSKPPQLSPALNAHYERIGLSVHSIRQK
jgi:hypothetical protein